MKEENVSRIKRKAQWKRINRKKRPVEESPRTEAKENPIEVKNSQPEEAKENTQTKEKKNTAVATKDQAQWKRKIKHSRSERISIVEAKE
jgi:hypothetical protein